MDCIEIFSFPVFRKKLSLLDNKQILEFCLLQKRCNPGRTISNVGGWQSYDYDVPPLELRELFNSISNFSLEICDFLEINSVKIANAWINVNGYKDFNWPHIHPNSTLSGVYYVKTPENCGNITFENSALETSTDIERKNYTKYNSPSWWIPSETGLLYIFPSWIKHRVDPNMNKDEERISISFNLK